MNFSDMDVMELTVWLSLGFLLLVWAFILIKGYLVYRVMKTHLRLLSRALRNETEYEAINNRKRYRR